MAELTEGVCDLCKKEADAKYEDCLNVVCLARCHHPALNDIYHVHCVKQYLRSICRPMDAKGRPRTEDVIKDAAKAAKALPPQVPARSKPVPKAAKPAAAAAAKPPKPAKPALNNKPQRFSSNDVHHLR
ncbi:hypothetical protein OEZ85_013555 [Tetradesmus obliquus]|uniref:Uncharacterized protein n=1 Tax=Tetradesmus obliquus TaxID=3088 RepID=A0ABY8UR38_TETOB|nr:hypothetical protein OEZ85_013555 [Tetradesmus obliquus]